MKYDLVTGEMTTRSHIGATKDKKYLTNEERHLLWAEEKRLAELRKDECRKKRELQKNRS